MKAPVDEMLVTEIAGRVAVVVTEVVAVADGLARLGFARQSGRGNVRSLDVFHGATKPKKEQGDASGARNWSE